MVSFISILTLPSVCMCALFIYTISISIVFASQEVLTPIESNQQVHDFAKWVIFQILAPECAFCLSLCDVKSEYQQKVRPQ